MGRSCGWCSTTPEVRTAWEARVLAGESVSVVAADTPFSESAAKRHVRVHLNAEQTLVMRSIDAASLHVHDLAERMLSLADEASVMRTQVGDPRTQLMALREEQNVLSALVTRLGIESSETVEALREARALAIALSSVLADEPVISATLARRLTADGEHDLARAFGRLARDASARHVDQATDRSRLREVVA